RVFRAPEPRLFDVNDPLGACPACNGAGVTGRSADVCSACQGRRWNPDALAVHLCDRTIADWQALPRNELFAFVQPLNCPADQGGGILLDQIRNRLQSFVALDLGYVTFGQPAATLSDGAARRIALMAALASNLVHVLYLIDEPTTGLHPRDTGKLLDALRRLRERGNTVVVIEHDRQVIAPADHVIDLGPGAGEDGGQIAYHGPLAGLSTAAENPTSDFWSGRRFAEIPKRRRKPTGFLKLSGAAPNKLQNLKVDFPPGGLCVGTR